MSSKFLGAMKRITSSPTLNIIVGLIFLVSGANEIYEALDDEVKSLGTEHGAVLFGLLHVLKNLPDLFEGLEYVQHDDD